jgi:hypothetical protein
MNFTSHWTREKEVKNLFSLQTLEKIRKFINIPLVRTKALGKKPDQAMWSLGDWCGAAGRNSVRLAAELAREVGKTTRGSPRVGWWPESGSG